MTTSTEPGRPRRKGERSRARLLQVAARAFGRHGYHETKVSDIVTAAGLTQAAFYLYFSGKEAIFAALVEDFRARLRELKEAMRPASGMSMTDVAHELRAHMETIYRFLAADPDLTRLALFETPDAEEFRREFVAITVEHLRARQRLGYIRTGLPLTLTAEAIVGIAERLTVRYLLTGERDPAALAAEATDVVLHGILARPGTEVGPS